MTHLLPLLAEAAAWWAVLAAFGSAAAPLAARLLAPWPDRGLALARPLGLLAGGLALWFGNALGLLGRGVGSAAVALGVVALLGWGPALGAAERGRLVELVRFVRRERRGLLAGEALVLVGLLGWGAVRAWTPAIRHTEQPTDLMILNAVAEGVGFPPEDPWLAGEPLAYHDLGHWMVLMVARLAGSPTAHAYNLGQAAWLGLLLAAAYGIGRGLFRCAAPAGEGRRGEGIAAGLLAAASVALFGNLATWTAPGSPLAGGDGAGLWWWAPSRAILDHDAAGRPVEVITEFPAFTYLVGDLHAHLLAMPCWLLVIALVLVPLLSGSGEMPGARRQRMAALALASGAFLALDPWELPGLGLLLAGGGALAAAPGWRGRLVGAGSGALLWGAGLLPFLPFRTRAATQVHGALVNLANPTSLVELAKVLGTLLPALVVLLALAARATGLAGRRLALALLLPAAAVGTAIGAAALVFGVWPAAAWLAVPAALPLAAALGVAVVALLSPALTPGRRGALALAALGLALTLAPEIVYVQDTFATRLNTVFKLGLQAWAPLALAASHAVAVAFAERRRAFALVAAGGLALGAPYLPAALGSRLGPETPAWSFDALVDLPRTAPGQLAAIRHLALHARPGERVLAAVGESYRVESALVATATGRPTLLGWVGHEQQWRGRSWRELEARRGDAIEEIYTMAEGDRLALLLARWRIGWILLGPEERRRYGLAPEREVRLATSSGITTALEEGGVRLLRVAGAGR